MLSHFLLVWLDCVWAKRSVKIVIGGFQTEPDMELWFDPNQSFLFILQRLNWIIRQQLSSCCFQSNACVSVHNFILLCDLTCWKAFRACLDQFGEDNKLKCRGFSFCLVYLSIFNVGTKHLEIQVCFFACFVPITHSYKSCIGERGHGQFIRYSLMSESRHKCKPYLKVEKII